MSLFLAYRDYPFTLPISPPADSLAYSAPVAQPHRVDHHSTLSGHLPNLILGVVSTRGRYRGFGLNGQGDPLLLMNGG